MKRLKFEITINASPEKIWEVLWNDTTYRHWTSVFHPSSHYKGELKAGARIQFLSTSGDGMFSLINNCTINREMCFNHLGIVKNFEEQPENEETKKWAGGIEQYVLRPVTNGTLLIVEVDAIPEMADYFSGIFPTALEIVKNLAEGVIKERIIVAAEIHASLEKVWECWNGPDHIVHWCYASDDWHAPAATVDLRQGGKFSTEMAAKDGSVSFQFEGVYDTVDPMKLIQYTILDGRQVSVKFEESDGKVTVIESFEPEIMNTHELQRNGWQAILNNFASYVKSLVTA